jgi:type II secretory pathway component HofQ
MLLTLVLGTISLARAFSVCQTLTDFAQDTARAAAVAAGTGAFSCPSWASVSSLPTGIQGELTAVGINPNSISNFSVTCDATTNAGTSLQEPEVHVSFTYSFQFAIPFTPQNHQTVNLQISAAEKEEN